LSSGEFFGISGSGFFEFNGSSVQDFQLLGFDSDFGFQSGDFLGQERDFVFGFILGVGVTGDTLV